jgi:hypothetical protein
MLQTANLKAAAEREMKAVNEAINQQTRTPQGGPQSADSATAPLRARLNRAIEVMQEGLIERDTEVRSPSIIEALHRSLSLYDVSEAFCCYLPNFDRQPIGT